MPRDPHASRGDADHAGPESGLNSNVATIVGALRGMPSEHLLDLAIARLRAALPAGTQVAPATPLKFQLVPIAASKVPT